MYLAVVGLNHKTAPVQVRERLAVPQRDLANVLTQMRTNPSVAECVLVSTCNRTEAYGVVVESGEQVLADQLTRYSGLPSSDLADHLFTHLDGTAVRHLFRVASGVDSMVLGEPQVLGQVRDAYEQAACAGTTGVLTNRLFESALAAGKMVQTQTEINRGAFSVGAAAVELARSIFNDLKDRSVLLIGAGETAELVAERLVQSSASLCIANRTLERAQAMADSLGGSAIDFDHVEGALALADIVIASTASPHYILRAEAFRAVMHYRRGRPVFLIDLGVPRNIDPGIGHIDQAYLYNIDDLGAVVQRTSEGRKAEVQRAEQLIEQEVEEFLRWRSALAAVPVIKGLKGRLDRIATSELDRFSGKLSHLPEPDRQLVGQIVRSLINKISHHPITHIKDYANAEGDDRLRTVIEVFGIDHEQAAAEQNSDGDGI